MTAVSGPAMYMDEEYLWFILYHSVDNSIKDLTPLANSSTCSLPWTSRSVEFCETSSVGFIPCC